jgi:hypothetical protein
MFKQALKRSLLCLGLVLVLSISGVPLASAATAGNGLRVSPVRSDVVITPGETKTLYVSVTNVTSAPAELQAIINNFVGSPDETGNPAIIFDDTQSKTNHGLKQFVAPIPTFSLNPGEQKSLPVKITVPKDTVGGGYFGAVRFAPASASTEKETVSLASSVGSLILLKVPGDIKEQLTIASFEVRQNDKASSFFTTNKGLSAVVRFQNLGNIQEAPFGKLLLKDRSGKTISTYELNNTNPPGNVLPDSIRKFSVALKDVGTFGKYKVEGNFGYGNGGQLVSASTTFYVVPWIYIILFVAFVALLAFLVFGLPRLVRAYNRRVLRKAGRS